jgi:hypothetical protein
VKIGSTPVRNLANLGVFIVMVKDFSRVEMKLASEQHAHNQGMHPEPESVFSPASHVADFAFPGSEPKRPAKALQP